jgi:riboflavin kinase/FMN adenylyltransferase
MTIGLVEIVRQTLTTSLVLKRYGFEVEQISVQEINDLSISSTKIRKAISQGNMPLANEYLGYDYFLSGTVFKGKLGRTIGSPPQT